MQVNLHNQVCAKFKLVVKNQQGEVQRETPYFNNIVLNNGLNQMSKGTWINRCCVGSGNSTPIATQIQLDSFVASTISSKNSSEGVITEGQPYFYHRMTWSFGVGMAQGNLSEVGLGWDDNLLWNRALIRDINGNPTTLTVLSDEYLDVICEVRAYPALAFSGSFDLLDKNNQLISSHSYICKPCLLSMHNAFNASAVKLTYLSIYTGVVGSITSRPTGTDTQITSKTQIYPTEQSNRTTFTVALGSANYAHQSLVVHCPVFNEMSEVGYQMQITPPITKLNTQVMQYVFDVSWSRYESA